jgi:hypothetical protein
MSEEQYQTILATTAHIQTSLDSIDRRLELASPSDPDLEVPDWINSGARDRVWSEISDHLEEDRYPPPPGTT